MQRLLYILSYDRKVSYVLEPLSPHHSVNSTELFVVWITGRPFFENSTTSATHLLIQSDQNQRNFQEDHVSVLLQRKEKTRLSPLKRMVRVLTPLEIVSQHFSVVIASDNNIQPSQGQAFLLLGLPWTMHRPLNKQSQLSEIMYRIPTSQLKIGWTYRCSSSLTPCTFL